MIYLTGDTHRHFERIEDFCTDAETTQDDVLVILGDAGVNYCLNEEDAVLKKQLAQLPITLLCIHGNHEERPFLIKSYQEVPWHGGIAYQEKDYPNLFFAKDGEIYDLAGQKALAIGGAYSVDKAYRLSRGAPWFAAEQPSGKIKDAGETALDRAGWNVDIVLSHTCPLKFMPTDAFLPNIDSDSADRTTEQWLETIETRLHCNRWYFGHYHIDRRLGKATVLFHDFRELSGEA